MTMVDLDGNRRDVPMDGRAQPRRRLRGELARDRDRLLYMEVCKGMTVTQAAALFRLRREVAHRRIKAIPLPVKRALEAKVKAEGKLARSIVAEIVERQRAALGAARA